MTRERSSAFEDFYRRERTPLVRSLALGLGDASLAEEAVDEAMSRAYQRWNKVGGYDNPSGWVYRVARNWATSRLRRRRFRSSSPLPETPVDDAHRDHELHAQLAELSDTTRQAVVLRHLLSWTQEEIALALDIPTGTVKSRINRGLEQLRANSEVLR